MKKQKVLMSVSEIKGRTGGNASSILNRIGALLTLLAVVTSLFGGCCVQRVDAEEMLRSLLFDLGRQDCLIYTKKNFSHREEGSLWVLYGKKDAADGLRDCRDYAMGLSQRGDGFEIQILKVRYASETEQVKRLLRSRIEKLRNPETERYMLEDYQHYVASVRIYQKGPYLFLLATGDNDGTIGHIKSFF